MTIEIWNLLQENIIQFRLDFPVNDLINVTIEGAVDFPGTYTINDDSTV